MKGRRRLLTTLGLLLALSMILTNGVVLAKDGPPMASYQVTIQNLATGQPLSPPVAATHRGGMRMFQPRHLASPELEAIAEDGNQIPMFEQFASSDQVSDAVDVGQPLTPYGTAVGDFTDQVTFSIEARPGDRLSLATMLICTNDGFTGLNGARLPAHGSATYLLKGYDAGTEDNTERSQDIVDPCSVLGPVSLDGDPNGNEDEAVDTDPQERIGVHPGIAGIADLDSAAHDWYGPVAKVTVTRVDARAAAFVAHLTGDAEVPPVETEALGGAAFLLAPDKTSLRYALKVARIDGVTQAHIHMGAPDENGPVVAFLFGPVDPGDTVNGLLASGSIEEADLLGPLAGDFAGFLDALRAGELYVNVHTAEHPAGEIRGQIGTMNR